MLTPLTGNVNLKAGPEFQINTETTDDQGYPAVTALSDGGFVVTWHSENQDGSKWGVYGQRYDKNGEKAGGEFQINTEATDEQSRPAVTALSDGGFVVTWQSKNQDGNSWGVYGKRYYYNDYLTDSITVAAGETQVVLPCLLYTSPSPRDRG